tara:strand:- start:770 stop:1087 length:318 start_codon:yes stop_codon:yes gene_type:complete
MKGTETLKAVFIDTCYRRKETMKPKQGKLLRAIQRRIQPSKREHIFRGRLQKALEKGLSANIEEPEQPYNTYLDPEFKKYLSDVKKSNEKILAELMKQRHDNDSY